jgi:hypothetical protein
MDVLVEAERKYMAKLVSAMAPVMTTAFFDLFQEAKKLSQGRKVLLQYQALLKEVQNWNNTIVKQHTDNIIKTCAMFPNLLAAVFVILVKVMSAVKITSESKKLNIKLPTNDVFVHSCYIAVAKSLYDDPYIMVDEMSETDRRTAIHGRISKSVHEVVEDFVPVQQILDTYIPSVLGDGLDMGEQTAPVDPVESLPEPDPLPEPETPEVTEAEPEAATPETENTTAVETAVAEATAPSEKPPEGETKTVPVHHETLFDDAPDKK